MSEAYIVCEGYHDRAFWSGLLKHLGATDPGEGPGGRRMPIVPPWGGPEITGGEFAFHSSKGGFIRVAPARSKSNFFPFVRLRLKELETTPFRFLVLSTDLDLKAESCLAPPRPISIPQQLERVFAELGLPVQANADGDLDIGNGRATGCIVQWCTSDPPAAGLPSQQTLERLICASIAAAHPRRPQPVQTWLDSRPAPPPPCPKEHAWSYLAGWYADCGGYEAFMKRLWTDAAVVEQLLRRLKQTGVLRVAEMIANWS